MADQLGHCFFDHILPVDLCLATKLALVEIRNESGAQCAECALARARAPDNTADLASRYSKCQITQRRACTDRIGEANVVERDNRGHRNEFTLSSMKTLCASAQAR